MGAIPHQGQTGIGQGFQHGADPFDLFFSGQASDVEQQCTAIVVPSQQLLAHRIAAQLRTEQVGVNPALPQIGVLNPLVAEFLHHGCGGAEVEQGLVVGRLQQFPQQGFQHPHAVVLEVLGEMGVVAGDQRNRFGFGQPDATKAQHGWIHDVNQVRLEAVDRFGYGRPRQGQFEFGVEGERHGWNADQASSHVVVRTALGTEDHHLITRLHQMFHRFGETGDDAIHLRQEGFGEEGDFHGMG